MKKMSHQRDVNLVIESRSTGKMKNLLFATLFLLTTAHAGEIDAKLQLPLPDNVKAELILSYPKLSDKDFTTDDALKICKDYQKLYYKKYFYVFCKKSVPKI